MNNDYQTYDQYKLNEAKMKDNEILDMVRELPKLEGGKQTAADKARITDIELALKKEKVMDKTGNWNIKHKLFGDIDDILD